MMDYIEATLLFLQTLHYREKLEEQIFQTLNKLEGRTISERLFLESLDQHIHPELAKNIVTVLINTDVISKINGDVTVDKLRLEDFIRLVKVAKASRSYNWPNIKPQPFLYVSPPSLITSDLAGDVDDISNLLINLVSTAEMRVTIMSPFTNDAGLKSVFRPLEACKTNPRINAYFTVDRKDAPRIYSQLLKFVPPHMLHDLNAYFCYANEVAADSLPHAKVLIVDAKKGYLGSANFTKQGLTSRFELGVRLDEEQSKTIDKVLEKLVFSRLFSKYNN